MPEGERPQGRGYPHGVMGDRRIRKERAAPTTLEVEPVLRELGGRFRAAGHELYVVGGAVRDHFLGGGRAAREGDLATSAHPNETTRLLRGVADHRYLQCAPAGTGAAAQGGGRC